MRLTSSASIRSNKSTMEEHPAKPTDFCRRTSL
jgi:hypothetical protein